VLDKTAEAALVGIFERAERGEGFGNARFARTLFELTLNAQALRLAAHYGASLEQLELVMLTVLTADDVLAAARAVGTDAPPRGRWFRRHAS
jgi:stage V sporulation protein K